MKRKPSDKKAITHKEETVPASANEQLLSELRSLIEGARQRAAQAINAELVMLNWHLGERISKEILGQKRAEYGEQIVVTVSQQLMSEYRKGFTRSNLFDMVRFAQVFPEKEIVHSVSGQLSWTHFRQIIYLKEPLKREFYVEMCRLELWSVRTLRQKIDGMLYERTALSRKPDELIKQELAALREEDKLTTNLVFRDPYLLDFLGLADTYSERDLESAILHEMERFILELGADFAFVARQKRMTIDDEDFYLDLLFYHRGLRRLVAIELKLRPFTAADKGQIELYLRWLDKYERKPGEEAPIGLILCSEKRRQQIELLQLEEGDIRVAQYLTEALPQPLLEAKLNEAVKLAREQFAEPEEKAEEE